MPSPQLTRDHSSQPGLAVAALSAERPAPEPLQSLSLAHDHRNQLLNQVGTQFELAPIGSPRRELFERVMRENLGPEELQDAASELPSIDLGPRPSGTLHALHMYAAERKTFSGQTRLGVSSGPELAAERTRGQGPLAVSKADLVATSRAIGQAQASARQHNAMQAEAVDAYKGSVNSELGQLGDSLADLDRKGLKGTEEFQGAMAKYRQLMDQVIPVGAAEMAGVKAESVRNVQVVQPGSHPLGEDQRAFSSDVGLAGEARSAGLGNDATYFRGWRRDQDVVLRPDVAAGVALSADPLHNREFLEAVRNNEEAAAPGFYEFHARRHLAALDQPLTEAPKPTPRQEFPLATRATMDPTVAQRLQPASPTQVEHVEAEFLDPLNSRTSMPLVSPAGLAVERRAAGGVNQPEGPVGSLPSNLQMGQGGIARGEDPLIATGDMADARKQLADLDKLKKMARNEVFLRNTLGLVSLGVAVAKTSIKITRDPLANPLESAFDLTQQTAATVGAVFLARNQLKHRMDGLQKEAFKAVEDKTRLSADRYRNVATGVAAQLKSSPIPAATLHEVEQQAIAYYADPYQKGGSLLEKDWKLYQAQNSTEMYRNFYAQMSQSPMKEVHKAAQNGQTHFELTLRTKGQYTLDDYREFLNSSRAGRSFGGAQSYMHNLGHAVNLDQSHGSALVRLGVADSVAMEHLQEHHRIMVAAERKSFIQAALQDPSRQQFLRQAITDRMQSMEDPSGARDPQGRPIYRIPSLSPEGMTRVTQDQVIDSLRGKWRAEAALQQAWIKLADGDPIQALSIQKQALSPSAILSSIYRESGGHSTVSAKVADELRSSTSADVHPKGFAMTGPAQPVGVADFGGGSYMALMGGYDPRDGYASEVKLHMLKQAPGSDELNRVATVTLNRDDLMRGATNANLIKKVQDKLVKQIEQGVQSGQISLGPGQTPASIVRTQFGYLDNQAVGRNLAESLRMARLENGLEQMRRSPAMTLFQWPEKGAELTRLPRLEDRLRDNWDLAMRESSSIMRDGWVANRGEGPVDKLAKGAGFVSRTIYAGFGGQSGVRTSAEEAYRDFGHGAGSQALPRVQTKLAGLQI